MFFTISNFSKATLSLSFSLSLSSTNPDSKTNFCHFPLNFSQGFCSLAPVRPFYPFFFSLFSFFMHFREIFKPSNFWGFWCLSWFISQLINGFLLVEDENMFLMIYFDQFGDLGRIEISRAWNSTNLEILFNWASFDEIGLCNWLIMSLYIVI